MGGGTGTGAAPVVSRVARELGILTVGVVTKPFHFEGQRRMRVADHGIADLQKVVDTLLIIPNQNLFRVANEKTTFADAFAMADQVLYSGVACITDLMVKEGLINLDFADVRAVMREMGKAMMGTGEAAGEKRALTAAEAAIANPLIDDSSMKGAKGLLVSITGGKDLTLYEVDEAATRIREEVDQDANIIVGATFDETLDGIIRVSVVATGIDKVPLSQPEPARDARAAETIQRKYDQPRAAGAFAPAAAPVPSMAAPTQNDVEHAAMAAVSAAIMPAAASGEDVTIRPLARSKPSLLLDGAGQPQDQSLPQAFIPPAPESVANRPRMPRIEDLPIPAQNEIRAQRGEAPPAETPDKRRMSLLQRLASVGLGRREEDAAAPPRTAMQSPLAQQPRQAARPYETQGDHPASAYGKRPIQSLDIHGRQTPVHNAPEEDQLEIPAFLRRQAN
jgi:cell division protein FtsZ